MASLAVRVNKFPSRKEEPCSVAENIRVGITKQVKPGAGG